MATNIDPQTGVVEPIATLMNERNLSINALADATLIPFTTLRRKLKSDPDTLTMGDLLRIATALGVAPSTVLPHALTTQAVA